MSGSLFLGHESTGVGSYSLSGTGSLTAGNVYVGYNGTGSFEQSGGTHVVKGSLILGNASTGVGSYSLSGSGSLTANAVYVGNVGAGHFEQSGGTHVVNGSLILGNASTGVGSYSLSGTGSLTANTVHVGYNGTGTFEQSGGTHSSSLILGQVNGGVGTYLQTGGTRTGSLQINNGSYIQTGGIHNASINMVNSGSYTLSGGTLNLSAITPTGVTFNLDGGTFNTTGDALALGAFNIANGSGSNASFMLGAGKTLTVGTEIIGNHGSGAFIQNGGVHTVSGNISLGVNSGSQGTYTLNNGTLAVGGSIQGGQGQGTLNLDGGSLTVGSGQIHVANLIMGSAVGSNGAYTLSYGGSITADNLVIGVLGAGHLTQTGGSLTATSLTINDTYTLAGGSMVTTGHIENNGSLYMGGGATISGNGTFTNNAFFSQGEGDMTFANTGANTNYGFMDLAMGRQFRLNGANLSNHGVLTLNRSQITGTGTLVNTFDGLVSGSGSIASNFSNAGMVVVTDGSLNISKAVSNTGVIELSGPAASLAGGTISNSGTLQGSGNIKNAINNTGMIDATHGTLNLLGVVHNNAGGTLRVTSGTKILAVNGLASNAGLISMAGGTIDTNGVALNSTGKIVGYGVLATGGLTNSGTMILSGGTTTVNGNFVNATSGKLEVAYSPAIFTGDVVNNGVFKTTDTSVTFAGSYTENGVYLSDPSDNYFTNLVIGTSGYLLGGVGDNFYVSSTFENHSLESTLWNTSRAHLVLNGTNMQSMYLAGDDFGALATGYQSNFAWGMFSMVAGASVTSVRNVTYTDWRLPTTTDTGTFGCNYAYSGTDCGYNVNTATGEMAHLFYDELGNKAYFNTSGVDLQPGWGLVNRGPFSNLQAYPYWSGTEYAPDTSSAWAFDTGHGRQGPIVKTYSFYALAVRPGDVAAVPEPETYAMMLAGLGLVGASVRRRKGKQSA